MSSSDDDEDDGNADKERIDSETEEKERMVSGGEEESAEYDNFLTTGTNRLREVVKTYEKKMRRRAQSPEFIPVQLLDQVEEEEEEEEEENVPTERQIKRARRLRLVDRCYGYSVEERHGDGDDDDEN